MLVLLGRRSRMGHTRLSPLVTSGGGETRGRLGGYEKENKKTLGTKENTQMVDKHMKENVQ